MPITLLAIETSCDETAAAVLRDGRLLADVLVSQQAHAAHGGVVPELASREHLRHIIPVVQQAMAQAQVSWADLSAVAFTQGPGLIGSLMVGAAFAKTVACCLDIPLVAVHHTKAHVHAHFLGVNQPKFPFLCLTVAGGHTQLMMVRDYLHMDTLGKTLDDAAGEAFDKTARLLGLPYPGGPYIDQWARKGNPEAFVFPKPQVPDLNFSFSGLKTAVLYFLQEQQASHPQFVQNRLADLCASLEKTIVDLLLEKLERAAHQTGIQELAIAGGVAANTRLRQEGAALAQRNGWRFFIPPLRYCTDNAAVIASLAYHKLRAGFTADASVVPLAQLSD